MGDSAGGNMALQLHLHSLSLSSPHRRPLGSVLLSPWLDVAGTSDLASYKTNVKTDYMSPRFAKAFATICREGSGGKVEVSIGRGGEGWSEGWRRSDSQCHV